MNFIGDFEKSDKNYFLFLKDLKPINAAMNVKMVIPPSTGTQGGGQHSGDGGPGCENN